MPAPERQFDCTVTGHTSCPAPPRLFVVLVVADPDGDTDSTVFPVLALRSYTRNHYRAPSDKAPPKAPSHEGMLAAGWEFEFSELVTEPLVLDPGSTDLVNPYWLTLDHGCRAVTVTVNGEPDREELGVLVADAAAGIRRHIEACHGRAADPETVVEI